MTLEKWARILIPWNLDDAAIATGKREENEVIFVALYFGFFFYVWWLELEVPVIMLGLGVVGYVASRRFLT